MKSTTFHFLAQSAKQHLNFEEMGLNPELTPLEHSVRTQSTPTRRMIDTLIEVYDINHLKVVLPKHSSEPMDIRDAIKAMGDSLSFTPPLPGNRGKGRPSISETKDLMPLKDVVLKYGFKLRDLAAISDMYPTTLSMHLNNVMKITPARLEQVLQGAQMLFAGNAAALRELRKLEKKL